MNNNVSFAQLEDPKSTLRGSEIHSRYGEGELASSALRSRKSKYLKIKNFEKNLSKDETFSATDDVGSTMMSAKYEPSDRRHVQKLPIDSIIVTDHRSS